MKKIFGILTLSSCLFFSCNNSTDVESGTASDSALQNSISTDSNVSDQIKSGENSMKLTNSAVSVQSQPAISTAEGMNPAHGQPGHRCEIAVGAPLNSTPTTKNSAPAPTPAANVITTSPAPVSISAPSSAPTITPSATAAPTKTAPGMNPPHGEPGHDCGIAVGAPLKK